MDECKGTSCKVNVTALFAGIEVQACGGLWRRDICTAQGKLAE